MNIPTLRFILVLALGISQFCMAADDSSSSFKAIEQFSVSYLLKIACLEVSVGIPGIGDGAVGIWAAL